MSVKLQCRECGSGAIGFEKTEKGLILICQICETKEEYNDGDTL
jgi:hypothetical protein